MPEIKQENLIKSSDYQSYRKESLKSGIKGGLLGLAAYGALAGAMVLAMPAVAAGSAAALSVGTVAGICALAVAGAACLYGAYNAAIESHARHEEYSSKRSAQNLAQALSEMKSQGHSVEFPQNERADGKSWAAASHSQTNTSTLQR